MAIVIAKFALLSFVFVFGFPAWIKAIRGGTIAAMQNILWEVPLAAFITLQWLQ